MNDWKRLEGVDPAKLFFLDKTGFWVGISRAVARALKGKRAYSLRKFYRGKKMTLIGAIQEGKVLVTKVLAGSMEGNDFWEFIRVDLVPKLEAGAVLSSESY